MPQKSRNKQHAIIKRKLAYGDMKKCTVQKVCVPSGDYKMKMLILRPTVNKQARDKTPGILWIHGGGYAVGMAGM